MSFLPALLSLSPSEIDKGYRQLLTYSIKLGGLAIRNPVDTTQDIHLASLAATRHLTVSLLRWGTRFDLETHHTCAIEAGQAARRSRLIDERSSLTTGARITPW